MDAFLKKKERIHLFYAYYLDDWRNWRTFAQKSVTHLTTKKRRFEMLQNEFQYYLDNQNELVNKYENKYIVVKDMGVVGVYDDAAHAIHQSRKQYAPGTYLVQLCTPGNSAYTVNACSRIQI